jgi:nucleoside-diphosphate-sugar epimerase
VTRKSKYDTANKRAVAEDELLKLDGCVLNLSGLWGGERDAKNWVPRVATTKEQVKAKKSVHLVHGQDVARAIVAVIKSDWKLSKGQRWMLTDGFVYDWWMLFAQWADVRKEGEDDPTRIPSEQSRWVYELMKEEGVRALPRSMEALGRCYDSREFWNMYGLSPLKAGL